MKKILLFIGYAVTLIAADMNAMLLRTYQAARRPSLQRSAPVQRPRFFSSPTTVTGEQPIEQQKPDPKDLLQAKAKAVQLQRDNFGKSAEKSPWFNVFFQPERVAPLSQPIDSQPFAGQEEMQVLLEKLESEKNNVRSFYERASDFSNSYDTSLKSAAFNQKSSFQKAREIGLAEQWRDHKASSAEQLKQLDYFAAQAKKAKAAFEQELQKKDAKIRELENKLTNALDISKVKSDQIDFLIKESKTKQIPKE